MILLGTQWWIAGNDNLNAHYPMEIWSNPTETSVFSVSHAGLRHSPSFVLAGSWKEGSVMPTHLTLPFLKTDVESLSVEKHKLLSGFFRGDTSVLPPKLSGNLTRSCFNKTFPTFHLPLMDFTALWHAHGWAWSSCREAVTVNSSGLMVL